MIKKMKDKEVAMEHFKVAQLKIKTKLFIYYKVVRGLINCYNSIRNQGFKHMKI